MRKSKEYSNARVLFGYTESTDQTEDYALHCHSFYEIYYFIEGDVDYLVEGVHYKLKPHSLLLLAPNTFHGMRVNSHAIYRRYTMHFQTDLLGESHREFLMQVLPKGEKKNWGTIYFENADRYQLPVYLQNLINCRNLDAEIRDEMIELSAEAVLSRILVMKQEREGTVKPRGEKRNVVAEIISYLNTNISNTVTLDEISEKFFISKHHLNKVFRKYTGTTVMDYLQRKRVAHAQRLLRDGCTAKEAAAQSGFGEYSSFYRAYVQIMGHEPSRDRGMDMKQEKLFETL